MAPTQPEDFIAKQGTDGLRQMIMLSEMHNEDCMRIAALEHCSV